MTRPEVAAMLRAFADEFEADEYGAGSEALLYWIAALAKLDADEVLSLRTEILCWGD